MKKASRILSRENKITQHIAKCIMKRSPVIDLDPPSPPHADHDRGNRMIKRPRLIARPAMHPETFYLTKCFDRSDGVVLSDLLDNHADRKRMVRLTLGTYDMDLQWLLEQLRPLLSMHQDAQCVIAHGSRDLQEAYNSFRRMSAASSSAEESLSEEMQVMFAMLASLRVELFMPHLPIEFGTFHAKFILQYFEDSVAFTVSTANLSEYQFKGIVNAVWQQSFPRKADGAVRTCDFEETLADFLANVGLPADVDMVRQYDWTSATVDLITSVPGHHWREKRSRYGHLKLRSLLEKDELPSNATKISRPICLFSSCGSIYEKWLKELSESLTVRPHFVASGSEKVSLLHAPKRESTSHQAQIPRLIWPSVESVRTSRDGYRGSGHYCFFGKVVKPFMKDHMREWQPRPYLARTLYHMKLYFQHYQVEKDCDIEAANTATKDKKMDDMGQASNAPTYLVPYAVVTSSNLSIAAWGRLELNERKFFVRSFEMGVVFRPRQPGQRLIIADRPYVEGPDIGLPIPFDVPPRTKDFQPYLSEGIFTDPDRFGYIQQGRRMTFMG